MDRVIQADHGSGSGQGLGGVTASMLIKAELPVEEEAQVPPDRFWKERDVPHIRGISKIYRGVRNVETDLNRYLAT